MVCRDARLPGSRERHELYARVERTEAAAAPRPSSADATAGRRRVSARAGACQRDRQGEAGRRPGRLGEELRSDHHLAEPGRHLGKVPASAMRPAACPRPGRAVTVGAGYVGLNITPRKPGRPGGLDPFGLEVDEVGPVLARLKKPHVKVVKRPSTRPFAGISTHDPAGNIFDLSQRGMENRTSVYVETEQPAARRITHFALRTLAAEELV